MINYDRITLYLNLADKVANYLKDQVNLLGEDITYGEACAIFSLAETKAAMVYHSMIYDNADSKEWRKANQFKGAEIGVAFEEEAK